MTQTTISSFIRYRSLAVFAFSCITAGCTEDNPCQANPPELVKSFGVPEQQVEGQDGLCYTVDPKVKNFGSPCADSMVCGGGLICPGEDLPICTAVDCNPDPKKDTVCPKQGFACVATNADWPPTICVPLPPSPPPAATSAEPVSDAAAPTSDAAELVVDAETMEEPAAPNIGTSCAAMGDPVCVNGTFCPGNAALPYCTVMDCVAGGTQEGACSDAGGTCYTGAGAPPNGICTMN